jgi:hypothetical protein
MTLQDSPPAAPEAGERAVSDKKAKRPRTSLRLGVAVPFLAAALALVVASGVLFVWSTLQVSFAQSANTEAKAAASVRETAMIDAEARARIARKAGSEAKAAADIKAAEVDIMGTAGYSPGGTGVYFKFAAPSDYTCGSFECVYVTIMTTDPCNAGVYVAASKMRGGTSIGFTNAITAGMPAFGSASVLLQDTSNSGVSFQLTDVHCMG